MMCVGERLYTSGNTVEFGPTDAEMSANGGAMSADDDINAAAAAVAAAAVSVVTDLDDSLQNSCTLPPVDDDIQSNDTTGK